MKNRKERPVKVLDNIVYGNITDVMRLALAMRSGDASNLEIERLDLRPIKAFKLTPQGGVEVELYDRLAWHVALKKEEPPERSLYEVIGKSAQLLEKLSAGSDEE